MSHPPFIPNARLDRTKWRVRVDEEITLDEIHRTVFGERLREQHDPVLEAPLTARMGELLKALENVPSDRL